MARGRMIRRRISYSKKYASVKSWRARELYLLMLPHTDAEGRLEACTLLLKGQVVPLLPYSPKQIQDALEQLHEADLIYLYESGGEQYLEFTQFHKFNVVRADREAKSDIPEPESPNSRATPEQLQSDAGNIPHKRREVKRSIREEKRTFSAPTLEQVKDYIKAKRYDVNAQKFYDYFTESNWIDSKGNKVRNWKQKVITWSGRNGDKTNKTSETMAKMIEEGELV